MHHKSKWAAFSLIIKGISNNGKRAVWEPKEPALGS